MNEGTEKNCNFHSQNKAVNRCEKCGRFMCEECWKIYRERVVCLPCRDELSKKNVIKNSVVILIFILAVLPLGIKYRVRIGEWIAGKKIQNTSKTPGDKTKLSEKNKIELYEKWFLKGKSMRMLDKLPAAIQSFRECVTIFPMRIEAHWELGESYLQMNMNARSLREFEKVLEIEPGNLKAAFAMANIYNTEENKKKAIEILEKTVQLNSENLVPLKKLAQYLSSEKKYYTRAIETYSRLVKLEPDNDEYYYKRGILYKRQKKWEKAISDLKKAIKLDPSYSKARIFLAQIYYEKGDCDKAFEYLEELSRLYPMISWDNALIEKYRDYRKCSRSEKNKRIKKFRRRGNV